MRTVLSLVNSGSLEWYFLYPRSPEVTVDSTHTHSLLFLCLSIMATRSNTMNGCTWLAEARPCPYEPLPVSWNLLKTWCLGCFKWRGVLALLEVSICDWLIDWLIIWHQDQLSMEAHGRVELLTSWQRSKRKSGRSRFYILIWGHAANHLKTFQ